MHSAYDGNSSSKSARILRQVRRGHDVRGNVVALTFDDGPSVWSEQILDLLAAHDAHATFFVLGAAITAETRATARRIVEQGSELGNHTFSHPSLPTLDDAAIHDELARASTAIEDASGITLRYWRPPYFHVDDRVRKAVAPLGLREVGCSVQPRDWIWDADETVRFVSAKLQPGSIVDLHDGRPPAEPAGLSSPTREATVAAVGAIVDDIRDRGLRSVTVTELEAATEIRAPACAGTRRSARSSPNP
jgi:peptidoglycan/xylan/chitin deacetylase (PgdA/CDA1 family)